ncbi:MAG: C40 family peptidase [Clostridia bacterium]|nr:C40 family peptidase [Clostridia bacterium]
MKKYLILFLLIFVMCCVCASAEEADAGAVARNPYLDIAFSCLEEGNPILIKYNALTGANIEPMLKTGMPYYFGGQDFSRLLTVGSMWETSRYGIKGQKYVYGFDCVGFVRYIQTQMGDELVPSLSEMILKRTGQYKDYVLVDVMEKTAPFSLAWNSDSVKIATGKTLKKPKKYPGVEAERETFAQVAQMLEPGDLFTANHGGRHVMMFIGTLRQYGHTAEEAGEMGEYLDYPLFINCVWNPDYVARMEAYIAENGLKALPNKGGVCITIVGPRTEDAPHMIADTERTQRPKNFHYFELEGYHLSLLDLSQATSYVWWRTPADKRGNAN